jgi:hypothetical protein
VTRVPVSRAARPLAMTAELRRLPRAYFVGRRPYEAPEVYAVTGGDVRRLRPGRDGGVLTLDWGTPDARALELSHVLLTCVVSIVPSRALKEHFMHEVLVGLPDDGFVLDSEVIWQWLQRKDVRGLAHTIAGRPSLLARLCSRLRLTR